jgi:hypothetical protein
MQHQEKSISYKCSDYISTAKVLVSASDRQALCNWGYQTIAACNGVSRSACVVAILYFDRFLSSSAPAAKRALEDIHDFQLAFVTCLVIALKVHSGFNVESEFVSNVVCKNMYDAEDIIGMEIEILKALEWRMSGPTPHDFIDHFLEAIPSIGGIHHEFLSRFSKGLVELAMMRYNVAIQAPSEIAFASICCALQYAEFSSTIDSLSYLNLKVISGLSLTDVKSLFEIMLNVVHEFCSCSEAAADRGPEDDEVVTFSSEESPNSIIARCS